MSNPSIDAASSNVNVAELERQQQLAQAQARAAAEARARAEAEARARAAAEAKAAAETQRQATARAQEQARQADEVAQKAQQSNLGAQEARNAAQRELDQAKGALTPQAPVDPARPPAPDPKVKDAQAKLDQATAAADQAQQNAQGARAKADTARADAATQATQLLRAQQKANTDAQAAGKPVPFAEANDLRDAFDAGSLDAKAQERLFGARLTVTPEEAARADAQRVSEAAARSPREGAEELHRQLSLGADPAYRAALARESAPALTSVARDMNTGNKTNLEDSKLILKSLASSADLAGPEARGAIARQLLDHTGQGFGMGLLYAGVQANVADARTVELGAELVRQLRAGNRYEAADSLARLSPDIEKKAPPTTGDATLRSQVDLNTVAEERGGVETAVRDTDGDARARAQELIDLAAKDPKELPPGVSFEPGASKDRATVVLRDEQGLVKERTEVRRDGNKIALDSVQYDGQGGARRSEVHSDGPDGPMSTSEGTWKQPPSANPPPPPTLGELRTRRNPEDSYASMTVRRDGDKLVHLTESVDAKNGYSQTERRYGTQKDRDGINDDLDDRFKKGEPIDRVEIKTTNIPPAEAKGPDGKPAKATVTSSTSYSQGEVRLTGSKSKVVDSPAKGRPPSHEDLDDTRKRADKADSSPKSWVLEVSKPNALDTQTFVEGQKDLSVTTRKKLEGNTVTETTEGKVPNPKGKGDPVSVGGTTSRTFDPAGQMTAMHSDQRDAEGNRTVQDFQRTEARNAGGELEVSQRTATTVELKDGARSTLEQEQVAVQTDLGPQLVRSQQKLTGTEGNACATLTPDGTSLEVNGQRVDSEEQLRALPPGQPALGAHVMDGLSQQVRDFNELSARIHDDRVAQQPRNDKGELNAAVSPSNYGMYRLQKELTTQKADATGKPDPSRGMPKFSTTPQEAFKTPLALDPQDLSRNARLAAGAGGAASGLAGAANMAMGYRTMMQGIDQGNYLAAATGATGIVNGGIALYGTYNAVSTAVKGAGSGMTLGGAASTRGGRINPSVAGSVLARSSVVLGGVAGGIQMYQGFQNKNPWQVASGATTATAAIGGYLAVGAAATAWGGPAGVAVGLTIALGAYGVTKLFDHFDDSEHDIAKQKI